MEENAYTLKNFQIHNNLLIFAKGKEFGFQWWQCAEKFFLPLYFCHEPCLPGLLSCPDLAEDGDILSFIFYSEVI
jgi:hypothetical protein